MAGEEPIVGLLEREAERGELRAALVAAVRGSGAVVLVEGPPGIGKTWLLEDAAVAAARLSVVVSGARAHELEQGVPYGVVRSLLDPAVEGLDAALEGAGAAIARVLGMRREGPAAPRTPAPWCTASTR